MKRIKITHQTEYLYKVPVTLLPHRALVRPREGHDVHIESSRLVISPHAGVRWLRDIYGNSIAMLEFYEQTDALRVLSEVVVNHFDEYPLDFLIDPEAISYPFLYSMEEEAELIPYRLASFPRDGAQLREWLADLYTPGKLINTFDLLSSLNTRIHEKFLYVKARGVGRADSAETIALGSGSCRDYAVFMMESARQWGFGARFVTGVHPDEPRPARFDACVDGNLHPGRRMARFDPTNDKVAGSEHVSVAVARDPEKGIPAVGALARTEGRIQRYERLSGSCASVRRLWNFLFWHGVIGLLWIIFRSAAKVRATFYDPLPKGAFIVSLNHISHFDPPIITTSFPRKLDWLAMKELFSTKASHYFFTTMNVIPVDRSGADRSGLRVALKRLREGRVVAIFPEGGIRDGDKSIVNGAAMRPGVRCWPPCRARRLFLGSSLAASGSITKELAPVAQAEGLDRLRKSHPGSDSSLGEEEEAISPRVLRVHHNAEAAPHCRLRIDRKRSPSFTSTANGRGMRTLIERSAAFAMDSAMCGVMNLLQWRGRELMCTREQFDDYIVMCESKTREEFYSHSQPGGLVRDGIWLEWRTPAPSGFLENDRVRAWHFSCGDDKAPTVLILHALMRRE